ncbi:Os07g0653432 [Oryza sativa Japonica Group]|uniref:Os07g0653432 protein n=1 Tax=Oryza sativa subsp. japonica TaxID=39947 RepID=A0A0P0X9I6_ORYSJ|nr:Os07g0653432 [Oryza sativa Japonica Group]
MEVEAWSTVHAFNRTAEEQPWKVATAARAQKKRWRKQLRRSQEGAGYLPLPIFQPWMEDSPPAVEARAARRWCAPCVPCPSWRLAAPLWEIDQRGREPRASGPGYWPI